jgi:hypothetical protein
MTPMSRLHAHDYERSHDGLAGLSRTRRALARLRPFLTHYCYFVGVQEGPSKRLMTWVMLD